MAKKDSIRRFTPGPNHAYLGKFTKQKFLDQGHNLSQFDPEFLGPVASAHPTLAEPPKRTPETFDLGAPTTPTPLKEGTALTRLAEAGGTRGMIRRAAREQILGARRDLRHAVRKAGSLDEVKAALAARRETVSGIIGQRKAAYGVARATPAAPPPESYPGEPAPAAPTDKETRRQERKDARKAKRLAKRVLGPTRYL